MPYADIIALVIIIAFLIKGWVKGFVLEFFTFAGLISGSLVSVWMFRTFSERISKIFDISENIVAAVLFLVTFISIAFLFGTIGGILDRKTEGMAAKNMNKTLGSLFGAGKGLLLCGILFLFLAKHPMGKGFGFKIKKGSFFAGYILEFAEDVLKAINKLV